MAGTVELRQYDFSGGVNLADDAAHLQANQLADMRNFTIDETGILVKRLGSTTGQTITGTPRAFYRAKLRDNLLNFAYYGNKLAVYKEADDSWTDIDTTALAGEYMGFAPFQGRLYYASASKLRYVSATAVPSQPDNISTTTLTGVDNLISLCVHNDRLWASNGLSSLYYTDIQLANSELSGDIPASDHCEPIDDRTGQRMNGIAGYDGALLITMSNSLHYLYGYESEEFTRKQEINKLGCVAPKSFAQGDGLTFFLSNEGVVWLKGRSVQNIGEPIEPLLKRLTIAERATAAGFCFDHKYYFAIPAATGGGLGTLLCVFDAQTSQRRGNPVWTIHTLGGKAMLACDLEGDSGKLLALREPVSGASAVQEMFKAGTYADNGANIEAYAETRWLLDGQASMWHEFRELYIAADFPTGGSMEVTWTANQENTTKTGTITVTSPGRYSLPVTAQGIDIKLKFTVNDKLAGWKLRGYTLVTYPRRVNR